MLSLGCTSTHLNVSWQKRISLGASYWGARIADVFMKAQSSSAIATSHALIGSQNVYRISPDTSGYHFTLDGIQHIPLLAELGREEALRQLPGLRDVFFGEKAEPFEPCHKLGDCRRRWWCRRARAVLARRGAEDHLTRQAAPATMS